VTDAFAPAAFQKLSDADKLSAPAFEQRQAGVQSINGTAFSTDAVMACPVVSRDDRGSTRGVSGYARARHRWSGVAGRLRGVRRRAA
jgi:hypothetical protein